MTQPPDMPAHISPQPGQTWRAIVDAVAAAADLTPADVLGRDRHWRYANARAAAIWLMRSKLATENGRRHRFGSTTRIGHLMGYRDHTTVVHFLRTARADTGRGHAIRGIAERAWAMVER
jgi:chromosomal replication initiation ATPase DnaA